MAFRVFNLIWKSYQMHRNHDQKIFEKLTFFDQNGVKKIFFYFSFNTLLKTFKINQAKKFFDQKNFLPKGIVRPLRMVYDSWFINYESSSCSLLARTDPPWCEIIGPDVPVFNETALLKIKDDIFKRLAPQIQINSYIYLRHVTTVNML